MGSVAPVFPYPGGVAGDEPADPVAGAPGHFAWTKWIKQFVKNLDQAQRDNTPPGIIVPYGGTVAPTGWHLCDGTAHGSAELKAVLGGSDNTPDLRDKFILGASAGKPKGTTGGAETVTLTGAQSGVPAHTHPASSGNDTPDHTHQSVDWGNYGGGTQAGGSGTYYNASATTTGGANTRHTHPVTVSANTAANASQAHENMPPFYALTYIIKK